MQLFPFSAMKSAVLGVGSQAVLPLRGATSHRTSAERWALLALAGELCSSSLELECNRRLMLENASRRTLSPCLFRFEQARLAVAGCDCMLREKRRLVRRGGNTRRRSCRSLKAVVVVWVMCVIVLLLFYAYAFAGCRPCVIFSRNRRLLLFSRTRPLCRVFISRTRAPTAVFYSLAPAFSAVCSSRATAPPLLSFILSHPPSLPSVLLAHPRSLCLLLFFASPIRRSPFVVCRFFRRFVSPVPRSSFIVRRLSFAPPVCRLFRRFVSPVRRSTSNEPAGARAGAS